MPQIVVWFVLCLMVFFELKPYFFFFFGKSFGDMDLGCQVEISTLGSYTSCTKSFTRYLESIWNLGPFWYFYFNFSARVIYLYYTSQDHRHQGYFDISIQIISFSTITISISDFDFDIQISAWSSSDSIISHARIGNVFSIFNTCWYLCCHFLLFFDHSSADDLTIFFVYDSHSLTFWAFTLCLHYTKNCLLFFAHYTSAIAGGAIFCFACRICYISIVLDILRCAMICFFEWYCDRYLQILSLVWFGPARWSLTNPQAPINQPSKSPRSIPPISTLTPEKSNHQNPPACPQANHQNPHHHLRNASYWDFLESSESTWYASLIFLNCSASPHLSGWCFIASLRNAVFISDSLADSLIHKIS